MEKGWEPGPGNNRQCDINLVLEESEPEKGNKTETNFSVWSNREQGSSVRANRWPRGLGCWLVTSQLSLHYHENLNHFRFSSGLISVLCKVYINQRGSRAGREQDTGHCTWSVCHPEPPPPSHQSLQSHFNTQIENIPEKI